MATRRPLPERPANENEALEGDASAPFAQHVPRASAWVTPLDGFLKHTLGTEDKLL